MTVVSPSQALTSASNYRKIHANHSTKGVAAMAQNYTEQLRKDNVRDAIYEDLQNNCEVLRTSWSGNAFPANPKVGQPCYRVDEDKLYYWDGYKWSQKGGGGSAELKTMELAAATSERVSITLEGARCLDKNMMFVFVDKIAQDPSTYSMNDDGTVVNFNPAIPANAAVTLRWFDTDVGTFDTAIFASDAEFEAGELTNKAPNVKQVHSLSDMVASKLSGLELMDVGFAPLGIDESENKRRYLNGQVIIQSQFPAFTAAVKARMTTMANAFTTEENWQAEKTNSKLGQCGKFVVDDTAGTIRLPCVVNAQGLIDLTVIGGIKSESLPNITGFIYGGIENVCNVQWSGSGAFQPIDYRAAATVSTDSSSINGYNSARIDASRSSSTYQDNAPVQQEAVQYPYYIQVATGVEETLPAIREYKTNVPYVLGDSKYFEANPYNASWLESNGQYNSATVYPDLWSQLQVELNSSLNKGDTIEISGKPYVKRGLPVVLSSSAYTDYDFVVNQNDQTFRLPLLNGCENIPDWNNAQNISTNVPFTAPCDGWLYGAGMVVGADAGYSLNGISVGVARGSSAWQSNGTVAVRVKKGDVFSSNASFQSYGLHFIPAVGNGTLYYYVGDTVQDASLINAGAVLGQLSNVNDPSRGYLVDSYHNGTSWYRVYSDGWVEQGGIVANTGANHVATISLLKPYTDTNYIVTTGQENSAGAKGVGDIGQMGTKTTSSFQSYQYHDVIINWQACGYIR